MIFLGKQNSSIVTVVLLLTCQLLENDRNKVCGVTNLIAEEILAKKANYEFIFNRTKHLPHNAPQMCEHKGTLAISTWFVIVMLTDPSQAQVQIGLSSGKAKATLVLSHKVNSCLSCIGYVMETYFSSAPIIMNCVF